MQSGATIVNCTVSIDTSGDLIIQAIDDNANTGNASETSYIIDMVAPNIPSVSVDVSIPFSIDGPEVTFSALDNIAVSHYDIIYTADDG